MIAPFARIFETGDGQLLVHKLDSGESVAIQIIGAPVDGKTPTATLLYSDAGARDADFDRMGQSDADACAAQLSVVAGGHGCTVQ